MDYNDVCPEFSDCLGEITEDSSLKDVMEFLIISAGHIYWEMDQGGIYPDEDLIDGYIKAKGILQKRMNVNSDWSDKK